VISDTQCGLGERKDSCPAKRGGQPSFLLFQAHFAVAKSGLALYNPSTFLKEVLAMSREFDRAKYYLDHILKPEDKFVFQCQMCGNCCRNRSESIRLTGVDIFHIAKQLEMSMPEAVKKFTTFSIGKDSKLPLLYLRERLDGSCSLLRKGKCTVQSEKPAVCAIYPLGRMVIDKDQHYSYFTQPNYCPGDVGHTNGEALSHVPADEAQRILNDPALKSATYSLEEWLSMFHIRPREKEHLAWNKLAMTCSDFIRKAIERTEPVEERAIEALQAMYFHALYTDFRTDTAFLPQFQKNLAGVEALNRAFESTTGFSGGE
jgi:Fe-S-cluster containining protein